MKEYEEDTLAKEKDKLFSQSSIPLILSPSLFLLLLSSSSVYFLLPHEENRKCRKHVAASSIPLSQANPNNTTLSERLMRDTHRFCERIE